MDEAARAFRERVAAVRGGRRRCRYPEALRIEALDYVAMARGRGVSFKHAAQALGVEKSVLSSWRTARRVEGLDVTALVTLMRSLS